MRENQKNILGLQLSCTLGDRKANIEKVNLALEKYKDKQIDFLFLSEVWGVGWSPEIFKKYAEDTKGETITFLKGIAKKYNTNVIGGSYIRHCEGLLYNSCPIINREGVILGHYDKNHLFGLDGEVETISAGQKLMFVSIEGLKIGFSICYDIRFPELFRALIDANGENQAPHLLVNLSAWPKARTEHYTVLCKARAIENQAYFLGVSQCGEIKEGSGVYNAGNSILVDPFGKTLVQLDDSQGEIFAAIDISTVNEIRKQYSNLCARRKYTL